MKKMQLKLLYEGTIAEMLESEDLFGWDLSGKAEPLVNVTLDSCHISATDFTDTGSSFSLVDCLLESSDFSNLDFTRQTFFRTHFVRCKLVGTDFSGSRFVDCLFEDCILPYSNFSETEWKDCEIRNCDCTHSFFSSLKQKNLKFKNVTLREAEMLDSDLKDVDISDCTIDGGLFNPKSLNGLSVSREQAVSLSKLLGLVVKD